MLTSYRTRNVAMAAGLAVVAAILVAVYVTSYRHRVDSGAGLVAVYVAAKDIPANTNATALSGGGYLHHENVPRRTVVAGAITTPHQLGQTVSAARILAGEQITVRQFRPLVQKGILGEIAGNQRAVLVPGDPNQLLVGQVRDGSHVDVVANIQYVVHPPAAKGAAGAPADVNRVASRVILRNLLVLQAPSQSKDSNLGSAASYAILLRVSDSQAQKLFFAMKNGDWTLALRPTNAPSDSPESVETIESELGDGLKFPQLVQLTGGYGKESINDR
jgi:Flp pilus assembly protein CpaB